MFRKAVHIERICPSPKTQHDLFSFFDPEKINCSYHADKTC
jgi:hypothetical protein